MLWTKLWRDVRAVWPRLALMAVAVAVSLAAFGAVLFSWVVSGRETANAYASTEPASATILLDAPVPAGELAQIARTLPGVLNATGRTQFNGEVWVNGQRRDIPLQVFVAAADDPMRMAKVFALQRSWPPAPGEIFVAKDSLGLLGIQVGDTLTVRGMTLKVTDTVYDPSLSPSPQEQTGRAYLAASGSEAMFDQLKIQVSGVDGRTPSRDRDQIATKASEVGQWLQDRNGLAVREIQVPRPYVHPHQWQADALLAALLAGAAASLLMSAVLVANLLGNLFTQQTPQIGIMKATGARPSHIARLYLSMTLLVAAAATAVGIVPAILLGRLAVRTFLGFLGVRPADLSAPLWTVGVVLAAGLLLAPLMTLLPLTRASRMTVRAAIDHSGASSSPGRAARWLARLGDVGWLDRGLVLALRNTVRRSARFWLSAGLLAMAGTVFAAGMSLADSTTAISQEQEQQRTWDVDVTLAKPASPSEVNLALSSVSGVSGADLLTVMPAGLSGLGKIPVTRTYPDQGHGRIAVTAIPDGATTFLVPKVLEGRWLRPGETGAVVINQTTRANAVPGTRAGDTVVLILGGKPTTWQVAGVVEERMGGGGGIYATSAGLNAATGQTAQVSQLRVITASHDEPARQAAADAIRKTLTQQGITVTGSDSVSRRQSISEGHLGPVVLILLGIALPLGIAGMIGLASTMSANVLDRIREFGVMHAIGAKPATVRRIVVAEGIFLALISSVMAIVPALGLTALLGSGLGNLFFFAPLPYRFSVLAAVVWAVFAVLATVLACEAAASRAARLTVRETLAYL